MAKRAHWQPLHSLQSMRAYRTSGRAERRCEDVCTQRSAARELRRVVAAAALMMPRCDAWSRLRLRRQQLAMRARCCAAGSLRSRKRWRGGRSTRWITCGGSHRRSGSGWPGLSMYADLPTAHAACAQLPHAEPFAPLLHPAPPAPAGTHTHAHPHRLCPRLPSSTSLRRFSAAVGPLAVRRPAPRAGLHRRLGGLSLDV